MSEVSQLRILVSGEGFYEIFQDEWELNGLTIQNLDSIQFEFQGSSYPFWVNQKPDSNKVSIRFYSPKIPSSSNLNQNVFILYEKQSENFSQITPINVFPQQLNSEMNTTIGNFKKFYQNQSIYLPQADGEDHWLWALLQSGHRVEQEIQFSRLPVGHVTIRCQFWITPTNTIKPSQLLDATINEQSLGVFQVKGQESAANRNPDRRIFLISNEYLLYSIGLNI